jgi:hypothetical protein
MLRKVFGTTDSSVKPFKNSDHLQSLIRTSKAFPITSKAYKFVWKLGEALKSISKLLQSFQKHLEIFSRHSRTFYVAWKLLVSFKSSLKLLKALKVLQKLLQFYFQRFSSKTKLSLTFSNFQLVTNRSNLHESHSIPIPNPISLHNLPSSIIKPFNFICLLRNREDKQKNRWKLSGT